MNWGFRMKKAQIGSVFTANEAGRDIFLQLVGRSSVIGDIARVCRSSDSSLNICDRIKTLFIIGFPFTAAIKDGYLEHFENCSIPDELQLMQFRFPNVAPGNKIASWTILKNTGQQILNELSQEQMSYPLAYAVNIEKLEELIRSDWNGRDLI
jgi:hypothetical protein